MSEAAATLSLEINTSKAIEPLERLNAEYVKLHANAEKGLAVPGVGKVESELKDLKTTVAAAVGALDALTKRGGAGGDSSGFMAGYSQSFAGFSTSLKLMVSDTEKGVDIMRAQLQHLGETTRSLANQQITWGFKIDRNFAGEVTAEAKKAFEASVQYDRAWEEAHAANLSRMLSLQRSHDDAVAASRTRSSVERIRIIEQEAEQERAAVLASQLRSTVEYVRIKEQEAEAVRASQIRSSVERIRVTEQLAEEERAAVLASQRRSTVELVRIKEQEAEAVRASQIRSSVERIRVEEQLAEQERALAIRDGETKLALERKFILASQEQRLKAAIDARKLMDAGYTGNMSTQFAPQTLSMAGGSTLATLEKQLVSLGGATKKSAEHQTHWNKVANEGHAAARGLSGALGGLWMTYGSLAPLLAGAALAGSMREIFSTGKALEYQFTMISAISNGAAVDMAKFNAAVAGTMFTPMEAAKGLRVLAQAGLSVQDATTALPSVLKLATVGETDMGTAALATTAIMHAFGLEVSDFGHIGDVFSKAAAVSATSVTEMMQAMKQASAISNMFGVSLEETGAALATLANRGIEGSAAGTAITNMVREMASPATKKAAEAMAKFGIETTNADGTTKSLSENLEQLARVASTMSDGARTKWLEDMFNARGVKAANILLNDLDKMKSTIDVLKQSSDGLGFMNEASIKLSLSTEGMLKTLQSDFQRVLDEVFIGIQPVVQSFIGNLSKLVNSAGFKEFLESTAKAVASLTTAFIDHIDVIKNMGIAYLAFKGFTILEAGVSAAIAGFSAMNAAIAANTAVLGVANGLFVTMAEGMALLLGPATLVAAAIAAVGYSAYKAYDMIYGMTDAQQKAADQAQGFADANRTIRTELDKGVEALEKDAIALREQIRLMRMGKSEAEAYALSLRQIPLALAEKNVAESRKAFMDADAGVKAVPKVNFGAGIPFIDPFAKERNGAENLLDVTFKAHIAAQRELGKARESAQKAEIQAKENLTLRAQQTELASAKSQNERLLKIQKDGIAASEVLAKGNLNSKMRATLQAQVDQGKKASAFKPIADGSDGSALASPADVLERKVQLDELKDNSYRPSSSSADRAALKTAGLESRANREQLAYYASEQKGELDILNSTYQSKLISAEDYRANVEAIYKRHAGELEAGYQAEVKRTADILESASGDAKKQAEIDHSKALKAQTDYFNSKALLLKKSFDSEEKISQEGWARINKQIAEQEAITERAKQKLQSDRLKLSMTPEQIAYYDASQSSLGSSDKAIADQKAVIETMRNKTDADGAKVYEETSDAIQEQIAMLDKLIEARGRLAASAGETAAEEAKFKDSFEYGWASAFKSYSDNANSSAKAASEMFSMASKTMEASIVEFVTTGKMSFKSLASSILAEAARVMASKAVASMLGGITSLIGGMFGAGSTTSSVASSTPGFSGGDLGGGIRFPSANGNVFSGSSSLHQYANTVQTSPKVFSFNTLHGFAKGGVFAEAGPEAVMPLSRDSQGRLGVKSQGGNGGGDVNISITINESEGGQKTDAKGDANAGWNQFAQRIKGMILDEMTTQKRPGGLLYG